MVTSERWRVTVGDWLTSALLDKPAGLITNDNTVVVLGHGASTTMEHRTMERLANALLNAGAAVVRFNFLYTEEKRSPPDKMPKLVECFRAVADRCREDTRPDRLIVGGHSMGGRAASHLAEQGYECDGCILFSYPLHPAGQPEKLRSSHLATIPVPVLCLNGTRDDLCRQDIMLPILATLPATWTMHWLEAADHSYHVLKRSGRTEEDVFAEITVACRDWLGNGSVA